MPPLRIYKIHTRCHDCPYMALWAIEGRLFRVRVWSFAGWELTPEPERPRAVVRIAGGLMAVEPIPADGGEPVMAGRSSAVPAAPPGGPHFRKGQP